MNTLDAEFFFAEHDHVPLHIGSVAVFAGPAPSHTELIRVFEAKLPLVPRYRQAVRTTPLLDFGRSLSRSALALSEPSAASLNGSIGPHRQWAWTTAEA